MTRYAFWAAGSLGVIMICVFLMRTQAALPDNGPAKSHRTLTVEGSATVSGKLDSARVYLGVVTSAKTVDAARQENVRIVSKVHEAIRALDLKQLKTRTTYTHVYIQHPKDEPDRIIGYEVRQSFTILAKDADPENLGISAGRILDAGLRNGVTREGEIEFFKEDVAEMRRDAMTKAVENALTNAKAHAAGANVKILEVVEIDGGPYSESTGLIQGGMGLIRGGDETTSVTAGEWKLSRRVRVVCHY